MQRILAAEMLGTFCLVFAGTGAVVVNGASGGALGLVGIALAFGLIVLAMIHAIGDVSGAHINPAVSIGLWAAGRFEAKRVGPYIAAQIAGALAASLLLHVLFPANETLGATLPSGSMWQAFIFEILLTAMLMFVILSVTTGAQERGITAGIAISSVVLLEVLIGGPISGASMNPARSLAPALVSRHLGDIWIYLAGPVLGALIAVLACNFVRGTAPGAVKSKS